MPEGAPEWMVTFSDCMTLLLTFFVLLLSFSSFEPKTLGTLATSFAQSLPAVGLSYTTEKDSLWKRQQVKELERVKHGSEVKPVDEQQSSDKFMREKKPLDFKNLKVFTVPSKQMFLGKGSVVSPEGKEICDAIAVFLKSQPCRVVISENTSAGNDKLALERTYSILDYMVQNKRVRPERFNLSYSTNMKSGREDTGYVEIALLERHLYENE